MAQIVIALLVAFGMVRLVQRQEFHLTLHVRKPINACLILALLVSVESVLAQQLILTGLEHDAVIIKFNIFFLKFD